MTGGAARRTDGIVDYVIVGGGTAGCVLANRLSANGRYDVALIEAGPGDWSPMIHVPVGIMRLKGVYDIQQGAPDPSRDESSLTWMSARVLGGGSSINGMAWVRGNQVDYDSWRDRGCDGWGWDDVLPFFKRAETFEAGESDLRGGHGPQRVGYQRTPHRLTEEFIEAAQTAGLDFTADYNGAMQEGVAIAQTAQWRGFRHSEARAYLTQTVFRRNLRILCNTSVERISFVGQRASGVVVNHRGRSSTIAVRREVILSAGALRSPQLLLLSDVGPSDQLEALAIPVVANSPNVGANLQEHPVAALTWEVNAPSLNSDLDLARAMRWSSRNGCSPTS